MSVFSNRGLDLSTPDSMSAEEMAAFRAAYGSTHGKALDAYEFWLEFNPPVVKRHRLQAYWTPRPDGQAYPVLSILGFLYLYTILGYAEGIRYETNHAREIGVPADGILQVIELAFIRSGPRGIDAAWQSARPELLKDGAPARDVSALFPPGWQRDPDLFDCGCVPVEPELSDAEEMRIRQWYTKLRGFVPAGVELLIAMRPGLLKAYHLRLHAAMRGSLPAQMFAFMEVQAAAGTARAEALTAAIQLAHGLGLAASEVVEAIAWGIQYSGFEEFDVAARALTSIYGDATVQAGPLTGGPP
jgi:hypothetical protein